MTILVQLILIFAALLSFMRALATHSDFHERVLFGILFFAAIGVVLYTCGALN